MSFTLYINREKWLTHLVKMEDVFPAYLPVIKGNGYGFGNTYLAKIAQTIGKEEIAVGTLEEARQLYTEHSLRQIIVLTPALCAMDEADLYHCTFTVGHFTHLEHLLKCRSKLNSTATMPLRILLKLQSPMRRYGFAESDIIKVLAAIDTSKNIDVEGFSIHFPLQKINDTDKQGVVNSWLQALSPLARSAKTLYLSHVSPDLYKSLIKQHSGVSFRVRLGTSLWLNDACYKAYSTVLDVKEISSGEAFGYKQRTALRKGYLVCVSGGSTAGIGLEGPVYARGIKDRLKLTAFWFMNIFNLHLSPFVHAGKRLFFAEPPHMQTSLLKFPAKSQVPHIGDEIPLKNLRMTIASFDRIVEVGSYSADPTANASKQGNVRQGIAGES